MQRHAASNWNGFQLSNPFNIYKQCLLKNRRSNIQNACRSMVSDGETCLSNSTVDNQKPFGSQRAQERISAACLARLELV